MEKGSLKLKLKLGSTPEPPAMEVESYATEDGEMLSGGDGVQSLHSGAEEHSREKHKKSKKKKKKKEREKDRTHKHKRDRSQLDPQADLDEPSSKKLREAGGAASTSVASSVAVAAAFRELLTHLLKQLEKKDTNQFFLEPVTDAIAPGYSSIISEPMCFVTMREKIERGAYTCLREYEDDVKLIVSNCLKYNGPDTVYYSAGKKLLSAAQSVLSKDKLLALKREMPSIAVLPFEVVGVHLESTSECADSGGDDRTDSPNSQDSRSEGDEEEDGDDGEGTEDSETEATRVAEVAAEAARAAARALHNKKPTSTMGYLKSRPDGSVGFTFLSGCGGTGSSHLGQQESKPLNLGLVLGKLTVGSSTLHNYHDDKRTMAKPVKPIHYGSYSSFCPSYDSTFSNLSKEESDLVRATYGNETAVQYAESICEFSRDCGMATTLVDQLLNLLTTGQHSRTRATIAAHQQQQQQQQIMQQQQQQQQQIRDASQQSSSEDSKKSGVTDMSNLRSLSALGIDMSFLDSFEQVEQSSNQLSHTAELLQSLQTEQNERLARQCAQAALMPVQPTPNEIRIAERLTTELVSVARQLPPSAILPSPVCSAPS